MAWHFGPFRLDQANACLWRADQPVALRPKTFALLAYLVTHAGQLVTKEALLDAVWPETAVGDGVPKTSMGELRKALGETAKAPQWITTVHGRGYRFVAPVTVVAPPEAASAGALPPAALAGHPLAVLTPPLAVPQPATPHAADEGTRDPEPAPLASIPTVLADELGMRPLQAHCHLGLGTLYGRVGREPQARAALSTAIVLYRAMDMTFWLPRAEAALVQVDAR